MPRPSFCNTSQDFITFFLAISIYSRNSQCYARLFDNIITVSYHSLQYKHGFHMGIYLVCYRILDVIRFQSSLDPVFCSELCRVKSRFVSVRCPVRCLNSGAISQCPGHFRKWEVSSNNILCCACKFLQAFVFSGRERFIAANIF